MRADWRSGAPRHRGWGSLTLLVLLVPGVLLAQPQRAPSALMRASSQMASAEPTSRSSVSITRSADTRSGSAPWWSPVASAVIPGAGQFALGQQRSVAYAVTEAFLIVQAIAARRDGVRARDEYRSIAADVARRPFGGTLPVGPWDYYESMEKFLESGVFDRIPGGAIDPETDTMTFNGKSWLRARETEWADPDVAPPTSSVEYQRAMTRYTTRAVRDEFRWSWRDAQLQQDVYVQSIASANRGYQRATNMLSLIGANHLTSLIDAYVTVRIRRYGGVRVAGLALDGVRTSVRTVGDPLRGHKQMTGVITFVPVAR